MTALAIPSQEAADDPFRFLVARGWRPSSAADGTWRRLDGTVMEAQQAIDTELAQATAAAAAHPEEVPV